MRLSLNRVGFQIVRRHIWMVQNRTRRWAEFEGYGLPLAVCRRRDAARLQRPSRVGPRKRFPGHHLVCAPGGLGRRAILTGMAIPFEQREALRMLAGNPQSKLRA
jgi:hypothetical protein